MVMIKRLKKSAHPYESSIGSLFSCSPYSEDRRNHCCPVLEVLDDPTDADLQLIVMPLLRNYKDPRFTTVGEVVEFFRQAFEVMVCRAHTLSLTHVVENRVSNLCTSIALLIGVYNMLVSQESLLK